MNRLLLVWLVALSATSFSAKSSDYEVEPNNVRTLAMVVSSGQSVQGNIGSATDLDNYKYVAPANGQTRVFFRRPSVNDYSSSAIAIISILDADGTEAASIDVNQGNVYTTYDFATVAGRTYYIEVSGCTASTYFEDDCAYHRSEAYEITLFKLPAPIFETRANETIATAIPVASNALVYAQHSTKADIDYFRVNLSAAGSFFAQLSRAKDSSNYTMANIAIVDSTGVVLNSDDVYSRDGQGRVLLGTSAPRTVYVRVTSCSTGTACDAAFNNQYQIVTSFRPAANLSVGDVSIAEGNTGTKTATFVVRLTQATTSAVTFNIATASHTAVAGTDFVSTSLVGQSIPAGQTTRSFSVSIKGDTNVESNETFDVNVSGVVGAGVADGKAVGTIVNDDH